MRPGAKPYKMVMDKQPAQPAPKQTTKQAAKPRHVPVRTCVACRETDEKRDLLRVVRQPDGVARFDPKGKLSGRGAYVCARPVCIALARKQKKLERSLKIPSVPPDVFDELNAQAALTKTQEPTQEPISSSAPPASEPTADGKTAIAPPDASSLTKSALKQKLGPRVNRQESDHAGVTNDVAPTPDNPMAANAPPESEAENA